MRRRRYGRRHQPDPRDHRHLLKVGELQGSKHWREGLWRGDQDTLPACVGYACAHWLSGYPLSQYVDPVGIYRLAQQLDEWPGDDYEGTSVRAGMKVLELLGFVAEYKWAFEIEPLISAVLEVGPVVVGTNWYSRMDDTDESGLFRVGGRVSGGHAYLITGVDTRRGRFRVKNSWLQWGLDGRGFISFEDMQRLIAEDGEICLAMEQVAAPR